MDQTPRNTGWEKKAAKDARERAEDYKKAQQGEQAPATRSKPKGEAEWRDIVSQRIEDAMQQGDFDNLRGRGKPLNLQRNPHVPPGYELAFDLLQNNDLAPGWIMDRKDLLHDIEAWRLRLRSALAWRAGEWATGKPERGEAADLRWAGQRATFEAELAELNKRILTVNLQLPPVPSLELFRLRMEEELARADKTA